jgi:signal peptidase I
MEDPDPAAPSPRTAADTAADNAADNAAVPPAAVPAAVVQAALELWRAHGVQQWLPVTGASMLPALAEGDEILVSHDIRPLRRGDIVVIRQNGGLIAHRVIRRTRDGAGQPQVCTKGDNNPRFDPPTPETDVLGRVVALRRGGKASSLETRRSRITGCAIAAGTAVVATPYGWLRNAKQRWIGSHELGADARLVGYAHALLKRCARVIC